MISKIKKLLAVIHRLVSKNFILFMCFVKTLKTFFLLEVQKL